MERVIGKITIRTFEVILVVTFAMLIMNNALFIHSHKLLDGKIVTHSHPFNKTKDSTPFKTHTHSSVEFFLLQHLEILFLSLGILFLFISPSRKPHVHVPGGFQHHLFLFLPSQSRAPPPSS